MDASSLRSTSCWVRMSSKRYSVLEETFERGCAAIELRLKGDCLASWPVRMWTPRPRYRSSVAAHSNSVSRSFVKMGMVRRYGWRETGRSE